MSTNENPISLLTDSASDLAEIINEDHDTELTTFDILDYLALLGLTLSPSAENAASAAYLEGVGTRA